MGVRVSVSVCEGGGYRCVRVEGGGMCECECV